LIYQDIIVEHENQAGFVPMLQSRVLHKKCG